MFKKKLCAKCNSKLGSKDNFCSNCGARFDASPNDKKDFGMLGKSDFSENVSPMANSPFGGMGGGMLGKMLGGALNMLEKEMQKEISPNANNINKNFELFVNGKKISPDKIKVAQKPIQQKPIREEITLPNNFSKNDSIKFANSDKTEPQTNIRRLSDRIIYEIQMPGISSIDEIVISRVNKNYEIKALLKNKAYFKNIQMGLSLIAYNFESNNLILEFDLK